MSVSHELQHHRQHDPQWMYALEIFKVFSFLNPIAQLWIQKITDLQEFACDETLVDRSRVKIRQYARCLLKAAESALQPEFAPGCATGLIFRMERYQLKRRISMLVNQTQSSIQKRSTTLSLRLALFAIFMSLFAYGAKSIAQAQIDRTYTLTDVQSLLAAVTDTGSVPVTANAEVVKALNNYLNTPAKRLTLRNALTRMQKDYKNDVDTMLTHYDLPRALDAMPLLESFYQNLPEGGSMKSAGIWQFIPSTAIKMGMTVSSAQDDRLDVAKLNQLAGRLLESNAIYFDDIGLSILAFNWGDTKVSQLIAKTHSRDAWALVRAYPNDSYLPKLVAAMIIIANPKVTE